MPTLARLDRQASRPKSLATFGRVTNDLEVHDEGEEQAQSARAATRSWSYTGGTRDASFKKKPKLPFSDADTNPVQPKPQNQRAVGFASVLSLSGWAESDAEEVELGLQPTLQSETAQNEPAADASLGSASASAVASAGAAKVRSQLIPTAEGQHYQMGVQTPFADSDEVWEADLTMDLLDEAQQGKSFKRKPKR